ncbi:MAG: glucose 1-dehydrogenase [Saprospiraceae bacterium]|nr:glucose 1-dehydrogenase [Saprospiraceae bacterium]
MKRDIFDLTGKIALVTGASKGIGASIAELLAEQGAKVVINSRKQEALDDIAAEINTKISDDSVVGVAGQVGNLEDCQKIVAETLQRFGRVDILINNAATNPVFGPVEETDTRAFDKIMDVNVKAPFELAKLCLPSMRANGGGSIINISSIGGVRPEQHLGIYSVSKAALISLTKVMASEWGKFGVRANVICPGLIQTKFSEALWQNEKILASFLRQLPLGRVGQPEEIASLALFLASDASNYCTGSTFTADGGYLI